MSLSGYIKKDSNVPRYLVLELFEHVIGSSPSSDENLQKTLDTVNRTYDKNPDVEDIRGYRGLEEILTDQPGALSIQVQGTRLTIIFKCRLILSYAMC